MSVDDLEKRVARVEAEVAAIISGFNRFENKIDKMLDRIDKVVLVEQQQLTHSATMERAFAEIKVLSADVKTHEISDKQWHADIEEKCDRAINARGKEHQALKSEVEGWVNRGKGVWWLGSILWGAFAAVVTSGCLYMFNEVSSLRERVQLQEQILHVPHSAKTP